MKLLEPGKKRLTQFIQNLEKLASCSNDTTLKQITALQTIAINMRSDADLTFEAAIYTFRKIFYTQYGTINLKDGSGSIAITDAAGKEAAKELQSFLKDLSENLSQYCDLCQDTDKYIQRKASLNSAVDQVDGQIKLPDYLARLKLFTAQQQSPMLQDTIRYLGTAIKNCETDLWNSKDDIQIEIAKVLKDKLIAAKNKFEQLPSNLEKAYNNVNFVHLLKQTYLCQKLKQNCNISKNTELKHYQLFYAALATFIKNLDSTTFPELKEKLTAFYQIKIDSNTPDVTPLTSLFSVIENYLKKFCNSPQDIIWNLIYDILNLQKQVPETRNGLNQRGFSLKELSDQPTHKYYFKFQSSDDPACYYDFRNRLTAFISEQEANEIIAENQLQLLHYQLVTLPVAESNQPDLIRRPGLY